MNHTLLLRLRWLYENSNSWYLIFGYYDWAEFGAIMRACRVVNKYKEDFDVNIQRGTMWGNPFKDGTREENIKNFKEYFIAKIKSGEIKREHLETLRGMRIACTCKPKDCHGDVIALVVNKLFKDTFSLEDL